MTPDEAPWALLLADDPVVRQRLAPLLDRQGLPLSLGSGMPETGTPTLVVCPVDDEHALGQIAACRARWPSVILVGYLRLPNQELWRSAQRGGCDLVTTRGALARSLGELLQQRAQGVGRRFPLLDIADAAGRLGFIMSVDDTPSGPVALYRVQGQWCAISDSCPHAGAPLSEGELEGSVVTCPRHGSQFDVRTGERLRGPADNEVRSHRLIEDAGQLWLADPGPPGG